MPRPLPSAAVAYRANLRAFGSIRLAPRAVGAQIRMARGYLRWSAKELGDKAGVAESTIKRMEQEEGFPIARGANIEAVYKTLTGPELNSLLKT
jgi:hypothetical protein